MQFDHRKRFVGKDLQRRNTRAQILDRFWAKNAPQPREDSDPTPPHGIQRPEPVDSAPAHGIPRPDTSHIEVKD